MCTHFQLWKHISWMFLNCKYGRFQKAEFQRLKRLMLLREFVCSIYTFLETVSITVIKFRKGAKWFMKLLFKSAHYLTFKSLHSQFVCVNRFEIDIITRKHIFDYQFSIKSFSEILHSDSFLRKVSCQGNWPLETG